MEEKQSRLACKSVESQPLAVRSFPRPSFHVVNSSGQDQHVVTWRGGGAFLDISVVQKSHPMKSHPMIFAPRLPSAWGRLIHPTSSHKRRPREFIAH